MVESADTTISDGRPEMVADMVAQDTAFWSRIINQRGITIEQEQACHCTNNW